MTTFKTIVTINHSRNCWSKQIAGEIQVDLVCNKLNVFEIKMTSLHSFWIYEVWRLDKKRIFNVFGIIQEQRKIYEEHKTIAKLQCGVNFEILWTSATVAWLYDMSESWYFRTAEDLEDLISMIFMMNWFCLNAVIQNHSAAWHYI